MPRCSRWCPRLTSARPPHTAHPGEHPPRACPRRPALPGATLRRRARTGRLAGDGLPARLEGLCGLGALGLLVGLGAGLALWGLVVSLIALLCLFFGQRLAKDYGGAVVSTSYDAVAILGLILLGVTSTP